MLLIERGEFMKKIFILILLTIFSSSLFIKNASLESTKQLKIGSQSQWLQAVKDWTNTMLQDGDWIYSNSNNKTYWVDAQNSGRRTNCALMIVHALQRFGVFEKNHKVYSDSNHTLKYTQDTAIRLKQIADIYQYPSGKSASDLPALMPGDIVYYNGHMNVYIGKNDSGVRQYYDAGRGTVKNHSEGGTWDSFINTSNNIATVFGIIRLKYNQTVNVEGKDDETSSPSSPDSTGSGLGSSGDGDQELTGGSTEDIETTFPHLNSGNDFNCETVFLNSDGSEKEFKKILNGVYLIIETVAPAIAIVLSVMDYIKALAAGDTSSTKKATQKTVKRIIIASLIMFLPLLLELLFHLFGLYDVKNCIM